MLLRDVANLRAFFGQFAPALKATRYGEEIWQLYQRGALTVETPLTGLYRQQEGAVDLAAVMREVDDARTEEAARVLRMQQVG